MSKILLILLSVLFFFVVPTEALAVTVTISNYPSTITSDPFNITVSIEGAQAGNNYVRVDLYKEGTTNYFGETYNGSSWYKGSEGTQYFPATIESGVTWSGTVQAKAGTPSNSEYDGTGSYKMRVRRYTSSGSQGSEDANNSSVSIAINIPTPTPVPTSTPTPTDEPDPTNTPTPTKIPTPTKTPTPTKKPTPTKTPTPSKKLQQKETGTNDLFVAGETNLALDKSPTPELRKPQVLGQSTSRQPFLFIILGLIILAACGILAYFQFGDKIFLWKKKPL